MTEPAEPAAVEPAAVEPAAVEPAAVEMVPVPTEGRIYRGRRRVRLGDVTRSGRLRLDATARYLQDVSNDDTRDAELPDAWAWVVRRTAIDVRRAPRLDDELELATFCSGVGGRWAERRVRITGGDGAEIDATTLWVHLDPETGRPRRLTESFHEIFTSTAAGRAVSAKLTHGDPPSLDRATDRPDVTVRPWAVRAVDLDVVEHVNNAVSWALVEEVLAGRDDVDGPRVVEVEFRRPVGPPSSFPALPGEQLSLVDVDHGGGAIDLWLVGSPGVLTSARIRPGRPSA